MKKKILLISANTLKEPYPVYPIGLIYIETYLKENAPQFEVSVFDCNLGSNDELKEKLIKENFCYIGISLRNIDDTDSLNSRQFIDNYNSIITCIRENSAAIIILGGAGFSIFPKIIFNFLKPDFGIAGEGEVSVLKLIECLENGSDYTDIDGLVYSKEGSLTVNPHTKSIDSLSLDYNEELIEYYWKNSGLLNIQTKRGCCYSCAYCTYPLIEGKNVRTLDVDKILYSLKKMNSQYGVDYFFITDSVFNLKNDYNIEFAEKLIDSGLNMNWGAYFNFNNLEYEMLALFKKAGLTHIEFGTDSLSDKQLKNFGKNFTVDDILEKSAWCAKLRINYAHFLILAFYGETEETLNETFANSKKIEDAVFFPYVGARIYPGTKIAGIALEEKMYSSEEDLLYPKYYISKNVNLETLKERAKNTGKKWLFPDEEIMTVTKRLREKKRKGPLWEYLKYI